MHFLPTSPKVQINIFRNKRLYSTELFVSFISFFLYHRFHSTILKLIDAVHPHTISKIPLYMILCAKLYLTELYVTVDVVMNTIAVMIEWRYMGSSLRGLTQTKKYNCVLRSRRILKRSGVVLIWRCRLASIGFPLKYCSEAVLFFNWKSCIWKNPVYIFEGDAGLADVNDLSLLYYTFATFVVSALKLRCSNKKTWFFCT